MYINPRERNTKRLTIVPILGTWRLRPQSPEWTHRADEAFGGTFEEVTSLLSALQGRNLKGHSRTTHSPLTAFCYRSLHPLLRVDLTQIRLSSLYFRIIAGSPYPRKGRRRCARRDRRQVVLDRPKGSGVERGHSHRPAARRTSDDTTTRWESQLQATKARTRRLAPRADVNSSSGGNHSAGISGGIGVRRFGQVGAPGLSKVFMTGVSDCVREASQPSRHPGAPLTAPAP